MLITQEVSLGKILSKQECELDCPNCNGNYLHHFQVDTYDRDEDSTLGVHTLVTRKGVNVDSDMTGNPSIRRHGLTVNFYCEDCDHISTLSIHQHKGITYLNLESSEEIKVSEDKSDLREKAVGLENNDELIRGSKC